MAVMDIAYDDFDSVIGSEANGGGFTILKPGTYEFHIEKPVEKERYSGSAKMPQCWKVTPTLVVDGEDQGTAYVNYPMFMCKGQSWKVKQFFIGLGLIDPKTESFAPPWDKIIGLNGYVEIGTHEYNGNTYNDVKKILAPDQAFSVFKSKRENESISDNQSSFNYPGANV